MMIYVGVPPPCVNDALSWPQGGIDTQHWRARWPSCEPRHSTTPLLISHRKMYLGLESDGSTRGVFPRHLVDWHLTVQDGSLSRLFARMGPTGGSSSQLLMLIFLRLNIKTRLCMNLLIYQVIHALSQRDLGAKAPIKKAGTFCGLNESHTWFIPSLRLLDTSFVFNTCPSSRMKVKRPSSWVRRSVKRFSFVISRASSSLLPLTGKFLCLKVLSNVNHQNLNSSKFKNCTCLLQHVVTTPSDRWCNCSGVLQDEGIPTTL